MGGVTEEIGSRIVWRWTGWLTDGEGFEGRAVVDGGMSSLEHPQVRL